MTASSESLRQRKFSIQEYLDMESKSLEKYEYYNGKIINMAGADPIHNLIATLISTELNNLLFSKEQNYFVLNSDQKIRIPELNAFVYPDAVVVCEKIERYEKTSAIVNPLLIVEVLSPSTESHDRIGKFSMYKMIPSFTEYLLVRQDSVWVNASYREKANTWTDTIVEDLEKKIFLKSIDCELSLKNIYRGITFE